MTTTCEKCKGTGIVRCGACGGAGQVAANVDLPGLYSDCGACAKTGQCPCHACGGKGTVEEQA